MGNKVTMDVIAGVNVDSSGLIVDTSKAGTGARSSIGVNSGKVYFEVHATGNIAPGLCDETNNLNSVRYPNSSSFAVQYGFITSTRFYIASTEYSYHIPVNLDLSQKNTIGFALNMDNYFLSIYLNGILAMDSFSLTGKITNLGEMLYPFLFTGGMDNVSHTEWNFGATLFKYPIPKGYTSYDGNQGNISRYLLKDAEGYKNLTELISTEIPTEQQFKEKGMSDIPSYSQLFNFDNLVTYTTNNLLKSLVEFKPKAKIVLSSGAINFSGKELKKVSLTGTNNTRVLFSKDRGVTWSNKTSSIVSEIKDHDDGTVIGTGGYSRDVNGDEYPWKAFALADPLDTEPVSFLGGDMWYDWNHNSFFKDHSWIQYAFKAGEEKIVNKISFIVYYHRRPKDFSVSGSNDGINFNLLYKGDIPVNDQATRVIASFNNNISYRYIRVDILSTGVDYPNHPALGRMVFYKESMILVPLSDISTQGLTPTQLTAITPEEWKSFMGDSSTLRFAYYLPDETGNTDKLELTVDFIGE